MSCKANLLQNHHHCTPNTSVAIAPASKLLVMLPVATTLCGQFA